MMIGLENRAKRADRTRNALGPIPIFRPGGPTPTILRGLG